MIITNHFLAGSLIAVAIPEPVIALSLAFASHFVMDALPHYGYPGNKGYGEALKHKLSYISTAIALLLLAVIVGLLVANSLWLALAAGLVAISPDIVGLWNYLAFEKQGRKGNNILAKLHVKFHRRIQWCERPWGIYIEIVVFVVLLGLLMPYL